MNDKDIEKLKSDSGTFARIRSEWYWQRTHVNNDVEKEMYYLTSCIMCSWCCFFGLCQKCWNLYVKLGFSHFTGRYFSTFCSFNNIESLFIFFPLFFPTEFGIHDAYLIMCFGCVWKKHSSGICNDASALNMILFFKIDRNVHH